MKKINYCIPFYLLFISACSTSAIHTVSYEKNYTFPNNFEYKFRHPASVDDQPTIAKMNEDEFIKLLHSRDLEQMHLRIQLRLDAIEEVYFRARSALIEFDTKLNESYKAKENSDDFLKKIIESGTYSHILALRENNLTRQGQLVYFMNRFYDISIDASNSPEEVEFARDAFEFVGSYYKSLPRQYLVAHHQIALELDDLKIDSRNWNAGIQRTMGLKRSSDDKLVDVLENFHQTYETAEVTSKMDEISNNLTTTKTSVGDEINKSAFMIQSSLINNDQNRVPQAIKIEPSTGSNGNITGYTFPRGVWAITFDDGPHPKYTNEIVANLKENNIKSTFFSLSKNVVQYPKITTGIKAQGMEIANHSHDHPQLPKLNDSQLDFQILSSTDKIAGVTGEKPRFFRCPYGAGSNVSKVRSRIAKEDMIHVFWSVDSLDWQDHNPQSVAERVKKQVEMSKNGGGVILFHDIHPQSVIASKEIMKYLKDGAAKPGSATEIKTIGEIVDMLNN